MFLAQRKPSVKSQLLSGSRSRCAARNHEPPRNHPPNAGGRSLRIPCEGGPVVIRPISVLNPFPHVPHHVEAMVREAHRHHHLVRLTGHQPDLRHLRRTKRPRYRNLETYWKLRRMWMLRRTTRLRELIEFKHLFGGGYRDRTGDLVIANHALSQLS